MNRSSVRKHLVEGPVTYGFTLHFFGGVLGWPRDTSFWALTIS